MICTLIPLVLGGPLTPAKLRTDALASPIGLDDATPTLSWIVESSARDAKQAAYRIEAATSESALKSGAPDLWDSGRVDSDATIQVAYRGAPLQSGQEVFWRVTTWDAKTDLPATSAIEKWSVGMLARSDWKAKWLSASDAESVIDKNRPSPYLRRQFSIAKPVRRATAYASAKGLYRLSIDGSRVGTGWLTSGWTDFRKRIQYEAYDVTAQLRPGIHAVGMRLGDGWFCGHIGLTGGDNYGKKPYGLLQLEIEYADGSTERIATDDSWRLGHGGIRNNDLLMGETYDATLEPRGWDRPGFDDSKWTTPMVAELGAVPLVSRKAPAVERLDELKPKKITQPTPGAFVYDLGQNMVGVARLQLRGAKAGEKIRLRFAEMLNPDGTIYVTNLRGAKCTDYYTANGDGVETYEPSFTFHGFRYVEVTGYPGTPGSDAITGVVLGSAVPQTGWFACSDPLVNQLQHNIYWGQRGNYVEIPTDCPQRDERLGWMGDAQIFVKTATFNNDVQAFMSKWTQDVVDAQSPAGGFSDVSPRMGDLSDGAPAWGDAGVIVPWTIYLAYGDRRLLRERYDAMKRWIDYIDSANPDHIWIKRSNNNFGDWLNVQDDTPRDVIATAYFAYSTGIMSEVATLLDRQPDVDRFTLLRSRIVDAFRAKFIDSDGKIKGDSQTCYLLGLRFNLLTDAQREYAKKRLVDKILVDRKGHLSTGFVGVGYINPTLTAIGRPDVAYRLLLNDDYPSWGYSIRQGATTIWERWDGWTKEKGFQNPGMNSFNHYSMGSVGEWMVDTVAGIGLDPKDPGFRHIVIRPIPGGGMTWASAKYDSVRGRIESGWKLVRGVLTVDVVIPANTTATITLPTSSSDTLVKSDLDRGVRWPDGSLTFQAGSGKYQFQVKRGG